MLGNFRERWFYNTSLPGQEGEYITQWEQGTPVWVYRRTPLGHIPSEEFNRTGLAIDIVFAAIVILFSAASFEYLARRRKQDSQEGSK